MVWICNFSAFWEFYAMCRNIKDRKSIVSENMYLLLELTLFGLYVKHFITLRLEFGQQPRILKRPIKKLLSFCSIFLFYLFELFVVFFLWRSGKACYFDAWGRGLESRWETFLFSFFSWPSPVTEIRLPLYLPWTEDYKNICLDDFGEMSPKVRDRQNIFGPSKLSRDCVHWFTIGQFAFLITPR